MVPAAELGLLSFKIMNIYISSWAYEGMCIMYSYERRMRSLLPESDKAAELVTSTLASYSRRLSVYYISAFVYMFG